jgi:hypothetical protein
VSDLERLVSLANMMGGFVRMSRSAKQWHVTASSDGGRLLAVGQATSMTGAILACLANLRAEDATNAE